jgi:hypothetical protein
VCLDPLGEFVHGDQQVGVAYGHLSQGPDDVQPTHGEWPCDGNSLQGVSREISLAGVELALFAGAHDLVGVSGRGGPIKALAKRIAHEGARRCVMATHARMDVSDKLATVGDGDAPLQDARRGALIQLAVVYPAREAEIRPMGCLPLERGGDFVVRRLVLERGRSSPEGCRGWLLDGSMRLSGPWALLRTGLRLRGV